MAVLADMAFWSWSWALTILLIFSIDQTNGLCLRSIDLANGKVTYPNSVSVQFECNPGYELQGSELLYCDEDGLIRKSKPFCAKSGCKLENGSISDRNVNYCQHGEVASGPTVVYCDGINWNTDLGICVNKTRKSYFCNFETEDQCGWMEYTSQQWERVSSATHFHYTGMGPEAIDAEPQGYYMRMSTRGVKTLDSYHFLSPKYSWQYTQHNACFKFKYFLYGKGVDSLQISVLPASKLINEIEELTKITGSQPYGWLTLKIPIPTQYEDFKVVFTGKSSKGAFGDIAIDDVEFLWNDSCPPRANIPKGPLIASSPEPPNTISSEPRKASSEQPPKSTSSTLPVPTERPQSTPNGTAPATQQPKLNSTPPPKSNSTQPPRTNGTVSPKPSTEQQPRSNSTVSPKPTTEKLPTTSTPTKQPKSTQVTNGVGFWIPISILIIALTVVGVAVIYYVKLKYFK
ncbi:zonadhesin [Drosophila takahashii]|uniref:zonadhesin n=1 Tax=Drosophila takahashii TaxID=29030 RepID=UPI001CF851EF|nr:uncharacterized protein LOC108061247 [Drosophila takahashii]